MNSPLKIQVRRIVIWSWYWLPPALVMCVIFYLSNQPDLPQAPDPLLDVLLKKSGHATGFAFLFLLLLRALRHYPPAIQALDAAMFITAGYAVSDELHQAFVPGRKWKSGFFSIGSTFSATTRE